MLAKIDDIVDLFGISGGNGSIFPSSFATDNCAQIGAAYEDEG